jgi:class 3 adenylate cyclase
LAFQLVGVGPVDLAYLQGGMSNVELNWDHPACAQFLRELSRISRLILTDRRGMGCSERFTPRDTPPIETLVDDVIAVLDAVDMERAVLFATGDCCFIAALFAAAHPERVAALILYAASPTWRRSEEIPWGETDEQLERYFEWLRANLGDGSWMRRCNPALDDERHTDWSARYERLSLTPGAIYGEAWRFAETDIRGVLPSILVPTLVLHRTNDPTERIEGARYVASRIRGARFVELAGDNYFPWLGDHDAVLREVERFLTTIRDEEAELDRVLATVLFTDVVDSTAKTAELGDSRWRAVMASHHSTLRALITRYRGREVDTSGDGFFATFDGPARAVRCAQASVEAVKSLGLEIRAGLHTGEVDAVGEKVSGIAVNIAARVSSAASASEVLVTQTVKDLVAGSGLTFEERGLHRFKGVPDEWRLYSVARTQRPSATNVCNQMR